MAQSLERAVLWWRRRLPPRRWFSGNRVAMLVSGDEARVTCTCAVDGRRAEFQIDCGSTYSQILPSLAPRRVPRHGLGAARCLGRRLWFPTCAVWLAPVSADAGGG